MGCGVVGGDDEQVAFERGELDVELVAHAAVNLLCDRDCGTVAVGDRAADLKFD